MAFRTEMGAAWANTTVVVMTEFGRTARPNGTRGTDHGTAGAGFVIGPKVAQVGRVLRLARAERSGAVRGSGSQADAGHARSVEGRHRRHVRSHGRAGRSRVSDLGGVRGAYELMK